VEFGFEIGFERIEAMSDARNERAVRFALGMGFEHEGLLRRHERDPQGELCDMVLLARLKPGDPRSRPPEPGGL
ncbi:MAG: GNAT family protein, partial [Rhizobacter sp.]